MFSFLFLSNFLFKLDYVVNVLPRRQGISGFYVLVVLIGLTFLTSWVNDHYIVGTVLLGVSRIFSSKFVL